MQDNFALTPLLLPPPIIYNNRWNLFTKHGQKSSISSIQPSYAKREGLPPCGPIWSVLQPGYPGTWCISLLVVGLCEDWFHLVWAMFKSSFFLYEGNGLHRHQIRANLPSWMHPSRWHLHDSPHLVQFLTLPSFPLYLKATLLPIFSSVSKASYTYNGCFWCIAYPVQVQECLRRPSCIWPCFQ